MDILNDPTAFKALGGVAFISGLAVAAAIIFWLWSDMKRQKEWREKKLRDIEQKKARIARKAAVEKPQ